MVVTCGVLPEPATWAMLSAGFGLVGSALRRRTPLPGSRRWSPSGAKGSTACCHRRSFFQRDRC